MGDQTYQMWRRGICPCCSCDLAEDWWEDQDGKRTAPKAIGEGVQICGRCIANNHLETQDLIDAILLAIAIRNDHPIDDLIASIPGGAAPPPPRGTISGEVLPDRTPRRTAGTPRGVDTGGQP